jgi:hypothetical protein
MLLIDKQSAVLYITVVIVVYVRLVVDTNRGRHEIVVRATLSLHACIIKYLNTIEEQRSREYSWLATQ